MSNKGEELNQRASILVKAGNELRLQKDFSIPTSLNDFVIPADPIIKNFGYLEEMIKQKSKKTNKVYFSKMIDKKLISKKDYKEILDRIYQSTADYKEKTNRKRIDIYDYVINFQTHWEDQDKLCLIFDGIKRYSLLENFMKKHSENITEKHIIIIYRHILESVYCLHQKQIYGCALYLSSFIYDRVSLTIKLTDLGFSKIVLPDKNLNDNKLQIGLDFNEYVPPEYLRKIIESNNFTERENLYNEQFDIWQLGILFYKIATFGESPYDDTKNEELKENILKCNINYSKLNKYSNQIIQIIDKMLRPLQRYSISELLNLDPFKNMSKIPSLNINTDNATKKKE